MADDSEDIWKLTTVLIIAEYIACCGHRWDRVVVESGRVVSCPECGYDLRELLD